MNQDIIADQRMRDGGTRTDPAIAADADMRSNRGPRPDDGARADFGVRTDGGTRIDYHIVFETRSRMNGGRRATPCVRTLRPGVSASG